MSLYLSVYLFVCLRLYLFVCLSVCLFICLNVYLFCLHVYLSVYLCKLLKKTIFFK